jgi:protein-tyrosine-phosphatase/DNA-binding transcriptional ArsR family regulator
MDLDSRATSHAALGDPRRLRLVDLLALGDRTVAELATAVDLPGNLLAHHLDVLEEAGLIRRQISEGDHRRRYIALEWEGLPATPTPTIGQTDSIAFICTHNSARSPFAAALWSDLTGSAAISAGSHPGPRVHPKAVRVATEFGIDLSAATPGGYDRVDPLPDLVVSVCDRARESGMPRGRFNLHWSVADPVAVATLDAFRTAFSDIAHRVERLVGRSAGSG